MINLERRGALIRGDGSDKRDNDGRDVDRKLELQELAHRIVDTASPHDGADDRGKVVVHENDVRSFLGYFGTRDTHRETDVGRLERRTVVGTVTSDTDHLAETLERFDEDLLVFGRRSSQHLQSRNHLEHVDAVELAENGTLHDDTSGRVDTTLGRDRFGSEDVVTGAHLDLNTCTTAGLDGVSDTWSKRVLDSGDSDQSEILSERGVLDVAVLVTVGVLGRERFEITVNKRESSKGLVGESGDGGVDLFELGIVELLDLDAVRVGLGDFDVTGAETCEHFTGTLEVDTESTFGALDDDTHGLAFRAEGDHLHHLGTLSRCAVVLPLELLGHLEQGSLGLGAHESAFLLLLGGGRHLLGFEQGGKTVLLDGDSRVGGGVFVGVVLLGLLEGGRVDGDAVVEKSLKRRADRVVKLGLLDDASLGGRTGIVLGLDTLAVGLETVGELEVDTDAACNYAHLVLSQGTGLVGADDTGVGHGLTGAEETHKQVHVGHSLGSESQGERDGKRQTFGHGDDNDGDGDDENIDEILRLVVGRAAGFLCEVDEEADHEGGEEDDTGGGTEPSDKISETVELGLQRSVLSVAAEREHKLAVETGGADGDDDVLADTFEHLGAGNEEAVAILGLLVVAASLVDIGDAFVVGDLANHVGFTSSARLVALDVVTTEEDAVAGNNLTRFELEDVTDDDVVDRHESGLSLAQDLDITLFLLGVELLELAFLLIVVDGTDEIDDDDGNENGKTLDPVKVGDLAGGFDAVDDTGDLLGRERAGVDTQGERDDGSDTEQDENLVLKSEPHEQEKTVGLAFGEDVVTVDTDAVLLGSIDEVGVAGVCRVGDGRSALDVVGTCAGFDGLCSAKVETAVLVCAKRGEDALDTAHLAELVYALGVEQISKLDGTKWEGTRVDIALTFELGGKRLCLRLSTTRPGDALERLLDSAKEAGLGFGGFGGGSSAGRVGLLLDAGRHFRCVLVVMQVGMKWSVGSENAIGPMLGSALADAV
ncbi:hypothetical protein PHBOTO_003733 [Pseudozyma hubeiensis]|nr:hypothetical protein PHBOTO_003733 [Pseudozyma hubeiensis]